MRFAFLPPLPVIIFISLRLCSSWRSRRLTSSTRVPLPAAMRRLRLGSISEGLARSAGVME